MRGPRHPFKGAPPSARHPGDQGVVVKMFILSFFGGEKNISFRMQADNKNATIGIELTHADREIQQLYFEQFLQFKSLFESALEEDWSWQLHTFDEHGKIISKVHKEMSGASIYQMQDWPRLISFFKPRIISLDEIWSSVKYAFEALR